MGRLKMILGKRTPPAVGYDLSPKPLRGAYRQGINMSGPESTNAYPTSDMLAYWASHGITWIRQPLSWDVLQPTTPGALDPGELAKISALLARAAALKMVVLLDLHAYGRHGPNLLGSQALPVSAFADFWQRFSAWCMTDPNFAAVKGYDLNNEWNAMDPNAGYDSTAYSRNLIAQANQAAITAIRGNGDASWLYIEGDRWTGAWEWVPNNAAWFLALNDPQGKLIASAHCYLDNDSSGTNFAWVAETQKPGVSPPGLKVNPKVGPQRLSKLVAWAYANNVRLHVGECGWGYDDDGWRQAGDAMVAYLKACNIEFTYWSAGYNFGPRATYPYNPDPYRADGSRDFTPFGTATPQGAVLQKYTTTGPSTYVIAWPQDGTGHAVKYGTKGQASAAFKILYGGTIAAPITITPKALNADGTAAGGTFTPASVTLSAGNHVNDVASFTYTPAVDGTFQILATNDSGLVDPAPIGFSTLADPFQAADVTVDPLNVIWPRRIFSPDIGPAITVRRASDGATKTVGFTNAGLIDTATLDAWANGSAMSVVSMLDQGVAGQALGPVTSGDNTAGPVDGQGRPTYLAPSPADYPAFVENAYNGLPALRFNASRMDAYNGIDGLTGLTVLFAVNPQSAGDAEWIANWQIADQNLIGDPSGGWSLNGDNPLSETLAFQAGAMHVYAVRFDGVKKLRDAFRDGGKVASQATTLAKITSLYGPQMNVGWFRYYPSGQPKFDLAGLIVIPAALTDAQIATFLSRMATDLGITQVGAPGAMTANGTAGQNDIPVKIASAPSNANTISWQYRTGNGAWSAAGSTNVADGASALAFDFTGLSANTAYDLQAVGVNGSYTGPASQLLGQKTAPASAGTGPKLAYTGVNISHFENGSGYDTDPTNGLAKQVAYWAGRGMTMIRVPFEWSLMQPTLGGALSSSFLSAYDQLVNDIAGRGMIAVVDCHSYGRYPGYSGGKDIGASGGPTAAQFAQMWGLLAAHYKNTANVRLDLMNEPEQTNDASWRSIMNQAISSIRQAGFTGPIHVPFGHGDTGDAFGYDVAGYGTGMTDSANNLVFEVHQYFDSNQSGTGSDVQAVDIGVYLLYRVTAWARRYGKKLTLGEFGAGQGSDAVACITAVMDYCQANADVWDSVTVWGGGDFGTGYPLSICPTDSGGNENYASPSNHAPQVTAMARFVSGGDRYGQPRQAIASSRIGQTGSGITYGAAIFAGFGGSTTGGTSDANNNFSQDLDGITLEGLIKPGASVANVDLFGCDNLAGFSIDGSGNLKAWYGDRYGNSSVTLTGGKVTGGAHKIAVSAGPNGGKLFVDGAVAASSTTSYLAAAPTNGGGWRTRFSYNQPDGVSISDMAVFLDNRYTAAYTPKSAPLLGTETGLYGYWPLHANLNGYT